MTASPADYEIEIAKDEEHFKYEASLNQDAVADLNYTFAGDRVVLVGTTVKDSFRHHGIATELIQFALDDIRARGKKVTIICPIVRGFVDQYPEYEDLVDPVHPGVTSAAGTEARQSGSVAYLNDEVTDFETGVGGDNDIEV
jgi:predicted GNAT family acetyltransferase